LSQFITCKCSNAKYEEVEFNLKKSLVAGEMNGKIVFIKGTLNGKAYDLGVLVMLNLNSI
jgi:hypothetical protein